MFLSGLDEQDQRILALLTENARLSYSDIGERVGLSRWRSRRASSNWSSGGVIEVLHDRDQPQKNQRGYLGVSGHRDRAQRPAGR